MYHIDSHGPAPLYDEVNFIPPQGLIVPSAERTMGVGVNDRRLDHLDIQLKKFSGSRSHHPPSREET
jgi:hypothetical protein